MKLNPIELNIRASWSINCAVAMGDINCRDLEAASLIIKDRAIMFLKILDKIKNHIEPPIIEQGRTTFEKKDERKLDADLDAGNA